MGLLGATTTLQARVALLFPVLHFSSCSRGAPGTDGPDSTGRRDKADETLRFVARVGGGDGGEGGIDEQGGLKGNNTEGGAKADRRLPQNWGKDTGVWCLIKKKKKKKAWRWMNSGFTCRVTAVWSFKWAMDGPSDPAAGALLAVSLVSRGFIFYLKPFCWIRSGFIAKQHKNVFLFFLLKLFDSCLNMLLNHNKK